MAKEKRPEPSGPGAHDEPPSSYSSPEGRYGLGDDITHEVKERLHPTDWNRRFMIIGAFVLASVVLAIFFVVVSKMTPDDAMPWIITVFNAIWGLVIAASVYYFSNKSRSDKNDGSPSSPPDPPANPPIAFPRRRARRRG